MLTAIVTGLGFFAFSAALARHAPWQWAFFLTMPFKTYDPDIIHAHVRGRVFTGVWLASAVIGSAMVGAAMVATSEGAMLALLFSGIILPTVVAEVQGYVLFQRAISELGLLWPPPPDEST